MKLFRLAAATVAISAMATGVASAEDGGFGTFSGSVAVTTDYVFRGYSQSDEHPAFQPGINWDSGAGFHLNFWASNIDFNDGGDADIETDFTAGYAGSVDALSYDIGVIYYAYPGTKGTSNYDYVEGYTTLSVDTGPATLSGSVYWSPDFFGGIDDAWAFQFGASAPIAENLTFGATLGFQEVKPAGGDYKYWSAGLTYSFPWFDANISYYDTDVADAACAGNCGARGVLTLSKSF